jgi:hypothetical protein
MVDEDVVGIEHVIAGKHVEFCELCGRAVANSSLVRLGGQAHMAEPVDVLRVCAECRTQIRQGEVPFDAEIAAGLQVADSD